VLAQRLGVAHRVRFVGMTDPRPYFRAADIVAIPSRWEGLSLVLLEAMACGATVLATPMAAGSLSNDAAIITTAGAEPARFAEQITRLLADPESRRRHARRARTLVERRYSLQRATNEYHVLVDSLFQIDFRADPAGLWENTA
jgi:glycosyltransferase involved in cell wall biosynthesis